MKQDVDGVEEEMGFHKCIILLCSPFLKQNINDHQVNLFIFDNLFVSVIN